MIFDLLQQTIEEALTGRQDRHGWGNGLFNRILSLSADLRGEVGERLPERVLIDAGVESVTREGGLNRTDKHWDIRTNQYGC